MTDASRWRLALARQIVARYPDADAALLTGSVAVGLADAYSDLDLLLYWHTISSDAWRKAQIARMTGRLLWIAETSEDDDPALRSQSEEFLLGTPGLKVDITHKTIAAVDTLITDVVDNSDTTGIKLLILGGMHDGIALHGNALIAAWQQRIGRLPEPIAAHQIRQSLETLPSASQIDISIQRSEILHTQKLLTQFCNQLVYALVALNRRYPPVSLKHLTDVIDKLDQKPMQLHSIIKTICTVAPSAALDQARALAEETFSLMAAAGYDISDARDRFNTARAANNRAIYLNEDMNDA